MDKQLKRRWIKALRSGKYRQTRKAIRGKFGFCCLGVLCDIENPKGWTGADKDTYNHPLSDGAGLTNSFAIECGIPAEELATLILLNDRSKANFKTIADYISRNL